MPIRSPELNRVYEAAVNRKLSNEFYSCAQLASDIWQYTAAQSIYYGIDTQPNDHAINFLLDTFAYLCHCAGLSWLEALKELDET